MNEKSSSSRTAKGDSKSKLTPPVEGPINVAFVLSEGATVIDFAGPWEVFQDADPGEPYGSMPFHLYTVSDELKLIHASGGLKIMPDYTFKDAPLPQVIVVPAQGGHSEMMLDWLQRNTATNNVTMSVCTGAFILARAGLLDGLKVTTHHQFLDDLAKRYPKVKVQKGVRFVENEKVSTAAGLSSGIDLALRVVERYFGRDVAQKTTEMMEYQGRSWIV